MAWMCAATRLHRLTRRPFSTRIDSKSSSLKANQMFDNLMYPILPSVVALLSGSEMPRSTGVFVDTRLIVTTARSVAAVSTAYDSGSCSVVHSCHVSRTISLTQLGEALRTRPVAVHFAGDLAVLEVAEAEVKLPPPIAVANNLSEEEYHLLWTIARREEYTENVFLHGELIRLIRGLVKTARPKAPWPLEEELGWFDLASAPITLEKKAAFRCRTSPVARGSTIGRKSPELRPGRRRTPTAS